MLDKFTCIFIPQKSYISIRIDFLTKKIVLSNKTKQ